MDELGYPEGRTASVLTPFTEEYELDDQRLRDHLDWLIPNVDVIKITSGVGEHYTLTLDEQKACMDIGKEKANEHDIPTWAHVGGESYEKTMRSVRYAEKIGLDGVRILTPYYSMPSQQGYLNYFRSIADETELPIMIYPGTFADRPLEPETIVELSKIENIVATKEFLWNASKLIKVDLNTPEDFRIIPGSTVRFYHYHRAGITGNVSLGPLHVVAPEITRKQWDAVMSEDWESAKRITKKLFDIYDVILPGPDIPAQLKYACKLKGQDLGPARRPVNRLSTDEKESIEDSLAELGVL